MGLICSLYRANKVRSVSTQAQIIGSNAVSALLFNDPQSAEDTLSALQAAPSVVSAGICTLDGRVFASYSRDHTLITAPILPAGQSETYSVSDKQIVLARSIVFKGKPTGIVWIRSDVQELTRRLKRYVGIAAIVMVASLLAAFFLSAMYRKEITEPIVSLAELARIVSRDKNYSLRATSAGSTAETSVLVDAFNNMLAQIQERDKELLEAHDELEQRVRDRTAELAAANKEWKLSRTRCRMTCERRCGASMASAWRSSRTTALSSTKTVRIIFAACAVRPNVCRS